MDWASLDFEGKLSRIINLILSDKKVQLILKEEAKKRWIAGVKAILPKGWHYNKKVRLRAKNKPKLASPPPSPLPTVSLFDAVFIKHHEEMMILQQAKKEATRLALKKKRLLNHPTTCQCESLGVHYARCGAYVPFLKIKEPASTKEHPMDSPTTD